MGLAVHLGCQSGVQRGLADAVDGLPAAILDVLEHRRTARWQRGHCLANAEERLSLSALLVILQDACMR